MIQLRTHILTFCSISPTNNRSPHMRPHSIHLFWKCVDQAGWQETKALGKPSDATIISLFDWSSLSAFGTDDWNYYQNHGWPGDYTIRLTGLSATWMATSHIEKHIPKTTSTTAIGKEHKHARMFQKLDLGAYQYQDNLISSMQIKQLDKLQTENTFTPL